MKFTKYNIIYMITILVFAIIDWKIARIYSSPQDWWIIFVFTMAVGSGCFISYLIGRAEIAFEVNGVLEEALLLIVKYRRAIEKAMEEEEVDANLAE